MSERDGEDATALIPLVIREHGGEPERESGEPNESELTGKSAAAIAV